ncbi:uncharacterized protein PV06_11729 [Exophiala oligosperma]|uniref:ER transporter 6TM N-terminal domain-containing protein n=1 Tax=Exophiala oligosperma TaxID=215243 RepID=A0A0D2BER0_9EURO|nr:uncharacterized protein PV06_11729 [Exophiala oligosperma]KIW35967.1 hypothetical protein PV06_11729 [Exophiala oligosperma]
MSNNSEPSSAGAAEKERKNEAATDGQEHAPLPDSKISVDLADSPYFTHDDDEKPKKKGLPEWLNHFNAKDLKTLFKCSAAVWIATLFLLVNPVLVAYGQATFFGCIVLFIVPCNGIVFIHVMGGLTMVVGMAAAWAWGVISMKAALATRPAAETNARLAQLVAQATRQQTNTEQTTGQSTYTQVLIFEGFMLDTRVTITYFCMIGLFVYLVARIRVAAPKLALLQVFAIVVSDIFLTIGPLIPSFSGTIPSVLIKPAATAIAIGVVCNIVFFPQSTSHLVLETMEGVVAPMKGFFNACKLGFRDSHAKFDLVQLQKTKAGTIAAYKGVEASLGFLALDLSTGRWSAEDVQSLQEPLRQLVIMFLGLLQLQITRVESGIKNEKLELLDEVMHGGNTDTEMPEIGHNHLVQALSLRDRFRHPETEDLLEKSMGALLTSSGSLLDTCADVVDAAVEALQTVNRRRWFNKPGFDECDMLRLKHEKVLTRLKEDQKQFEVLSSQHLLDPHNHLFDEHGHLKLQGHAGAPVHGLMLGLIFEERILGVASGLDALLTRVIRLEHDRTKTKIWFPTSLRNLFSWGLVEDAAPGVTAMSSDSDGAELEKVVTKNERKISKKRSKEEKEAGAQEQLDRLHFHRGTKRSTFGKTLLAITHWLGNTEGLYALRVLIVTIAMALPAVLTSSAGFYYREKGLWALIMSQTGLVAYTADFVYGFTLRTIGTVVGGILGMVCWYIGAGNGPGNPYGMAAIMALAIVLLMWARLFAPPALLQGVLLVASTIYLVVAYSWVDTHIPSYGNPGVGYSVFWRRALLVMIGFTASAIVIFIPRPPSASRHYRRVLSSTIRSSKDLYALYVTSWSHAYSDLKETSEMQILTNSETLAAIAGPIRLLKFEFSSSNFDAETLTHVTNLCMTINQSLSQLLMYSNLLAQDLKERFARLSGALDERIIGDLMAVLTLVEQSLKTNDPFPAVLPVPLIARCVGLNRAFAREEAGQGTLGIDAVREEGFCKYCVVLSAFIQLLGAADELVWRVKTAVGETSYVDIEQPFLSRNEG